MRKYGQLALAVALVGAMPAAAAESIVNGGFETGDFTGWTPTGAQGFTSVDASSAFSGGFGASFSPNQAGAIHQNFATLVGQVYTISFYLAHTAGTASLVNQFAVDFGGVNLLTTTNTGPSAYTLFAFNQTATTTTTQLKFTFRDGRATVFRLDGVSVIDLPPTPGVPEPATWGLLIVGFAGVGAAMRRRVRRAAAA